MRKKIFIICIILVLLCLGMTYYSLFCVFNFYFAMFSIGVGIIFLFMALLAYSLMNAY